jgi:hypothetical protein
MMEARQIEVEEYGTFDPNLGPVPPAFLPMLEGTIPFEYRWNPEPTGQTSADNKALRKLHNVEESRSYHVDTNPLFSGLWHTKNVALFLTALAQIQPLKPLAVCWNNAPPSTSKFAAVTVPWLVQNNPEGLHQHTIVVTVNHHRWTKDQAKFVKRNFAGSSFVNLVTPAGAYPMPQVSVREHEGKTLFRRKQVADSIAAIHKSPVEVVCVGNRNFFSENGAVTRIQVEPSPVIVPGCFYVPVKCERIINYF